MHASAMDADGPAYDRELVRLEDYLASLPFDRALPNLSTILAEAEVSEDLIRNDDRARKVLHEAILARPLSSTDSVGRLATEIEVLTLEVEVLTQRIATAAEGSRTAEAANARLATIRQRLREVRRLL